MTSGLPSYTLPPAEPAVAVAPPHGVDTHAEPRGTFGGAAAPVIAGVGRDEEHGRTDEPHLVSAFPGSFSIDTTMPISTSPVDNSGSLTGHILSQGWDQGAETRRYSKAKVNIALLLVLLVLVGVSFLFLATTGSAFSDWMHGLSKH